MDEKCLVWKVFGEVYVWLYIIIVFLVYIAEACQLSPDTCSPLVGEKETALVVF